VNRKKPRKRHSLVFLRSRPEVGSLWLQSPGGGRGVSPSPERRGRKKISSRRRGGKGILKEALLGDVGRRVQQNDEATMERANCAGKTERTQPFMI